jgi:hypothetical protein
MGLAELLFVASVFVPPAVLLVCIVVTLLPLKAAPSRIHEDRADFVSH